MWRFFKALRLSRGFAFVRSETKQFCASCEHAVMRDPVSIRRSRSRVILQQIKRPGTRLGRNERPICIPPLTFFDAAYNWRTNPAPPLAFNAD